MKNEVLTGNMKNLILIAGLLIGMPLLAQTKVIKKNAVKANDFGVTYSLPKTSLVVDVEVTKVTCEAGPYYPYAEKYLGIKDVVTEDKVYYTLGKVNLINRGVPDPDHTYIIEFKQGTVAPYAYLTEDGLLCSINTEYVPAEAEPESAEDKASPANVLDASVLSEELLMAGSTARQAEVAAKQIYRIRDSRLNILTGETGAGKSLLLGSVNLALGGKYSADMLRSGAKSGLVELTFTVDDERIRRRLEQLDLFPEDGCLTLSRRLMEGRSVSRINGETVSARVLRDAAGLLIDIHGQHENQTLLQRKNHLALLDLYAKEETSPLRKEMAEKFRIYQELCRKKESSALDDESRRKEAALAEFEVKEIEDAALVLGEDEELEDLYRRMTESRRVTESVAETYQYTGEDARGNASDFLSRAIRSMQEAAEFDETGSRLYGQLIEIDSLLNDFNRELSEYAKSFEFSDEEFQETETRLNLINHLKAKYGKTISEILAYCGEKRQRLTELEDYDTFMRELDKKTEEAFRAVEKTAEELHKVRERAAETFAGEIQKQMAELNFLDARLEIRLTDAGHYSASGKDEAEFYFSANPGEPLKPMGNVASGGELSRVMLAVKTVLADEEDTPTLIFDEIDTGISGITAGKVGEKLRLIGRSRQVICITHLPQIAAAADSHFLISKETDGRTVKTDIALLDEEASVQELARMLGGANVTGRILESAGEMKELAKSET